MGRNNGNRYSEEFKQGAIKLVLENKQSIAEACRNLGVSRNAMERWLAAEADSHDDIRSGCARWRLKSGSSERKRKI